MCIVPCIYVINEEEEATRCYLVFYYTYDSLNMYRAPLCPSSGAHDYTTDYHIGCLILTLLMVGGLVQAVWVSVRAEGSSLHSGQLLSQPAPNLQPSATKESDGPCGNQRYSCELLMMGIVVPITFFLPILSVIKH
jgi:hypothetical protein